MKTVIAAALGECVHVAGVSNFLRLACFVRRTDYWRRGCLVDKLGIGDLSVSELTHLVNEGVKG